MIHLYLVSFVLMILTIAYFISVHIILTILPLVTFSEVLKQVWDLSDQDNDSMLSLREFCTALYLMERYRDGRPLPAVLPSGIFVDFPTTVQPMVGHGGAAWRPPSGSLHICMKFYDLSYCAYMENLLVFLFYRFATTARSTCFCCTTCNTCSGGEASTASSG